MSFITPDVQLKPCLVTPGMAEDLLSRNTGNRSLVASRVAKHIARIRLGTWKLTHQGICVATTGRLLDGQHRLTAIIKTGQPQWIVVATGYNEAIYDAIDGGAPRSMADRTQLPRKFAEEAHFICRVAGDMSGSSSSITESAVLHAAECFSAESEALHEVCNTTARGRSTTPCRVAAILRMAKDGNLYAAQEYRNFVLLSPEISPVGLAMVRQLDKGIARSSWQTDTLARFWKIFDKENRSHTKIQISDAVAQLQEMRAVVQARAGATETWLRPSSPV